MKRTILATILGIAASAACSYGQGSFLFSTYTVAATSSYGPVHWTSNSSLAPAGMAGLPISGGSNIVANLTYSFNNGGLVTVDTGLAVPLSSVNGVDGYIDYSGVLNLPATYPNSSGAGPAIAMTINLSGNYLGTVVSGTLTWTEPGFTAAPGQLFAAYPATLTAQLVPEPATMTMLGLGSAALLIFRKRR